MIGKLIGRLFWTALGGALVVGFLVTRPAWASTGFPVSSPGPSAAPTDGATARVETTAAMMNLGPQESPQVAVVPVFHVLGQPAVTAVRKGQGGAVYDAEFRVEARNPATNATVRAWDFDLEGLDAAASSNPAGPGKAAVQELRGGVAGMLAGLQVHVVDVQVEGLELVFDADGNLVRAPATLNLALAIRAAGTTEPLEKAVRGAEKGRAVVGEPLWESRVRYAVDDGLAFLPGAYPTGAAPLSTLLAVVEDALVAAFEGE